MPPPRAIRGQATVELVALLPLVAVVALACWQAVVVGQAIWLSGGAARAAARAEAVGGDRLAAARSALPDALHRRVRVRSGADGAVTVVVGVPTVVGGLSLGAVRASARFAPQGAGS
jgi:hypothetical protein